MDIPPEKKRDLTSTPGWEGFIVLDATNLKE
jgi:hypothetical protein